MFSEYYDSSGTPATGGQGSSSAMRAEFDLIQAGFGKLPDLAGNGNKAVVVNAGGTALTVTMGALALAAAFTLSGAFATTLTVTAPTNVTLPLTGTLATLAGNETLTTKTLNLANNSLTGTTAQFNAALSDNDFATLAGSETLTTKTFNLANNTLTGTTAQFNTALSDGDFATLAGAEELTNKTLNAGVGKGVWTASGTWTLPAYTLGGTVSGGGNQINNVVIGTVTPLAATFTTITTTGNGVVGGSLTWGTGVATFGLVVKRKTADETVTSSAALQDDDHLTFAIAANEEWTATFYLDVGAGLPTTGINAAITVPAGATLNAIGEILSFNGTTVGQYGGRSTTSAGLVINHLTGAQNNGKVVISVWVLNGATPGNVTLQWCQISSSATPLTVRKGSYLNAVRVA